MKLELEKIVKGTEGELRCGDPSQTIGRICTDTRILQPGDTFVALSGRNHRGDNFLAEALEKGARGLVSHGTADLGGLPAGIFHLAVRDTTRALGEIARLWRQQLNPRLAAISGSAGKTTTKELLAFLCQETFAVHATEGNFNNHVGLPLTLLRMRPEHQVSIVELGMNHSGEIRRLCEICRPDTAILTNIGNAHIGNFGSMVKLIAAKAELFERLDGDATAVINVDCPHSSMMGEAFRLPSNIITFGQNPKSDVRAENVRLTRPFGYDFTLVIDGSHHDVHLKVYGRYQVSNALAAAAGAHALGVDAETIARRLGEFNAPAMRAQTEWFDGIFVITDCYNASPASVISTLHSLGDVQGLGRRFALLGEMKELGEYSDKLHREVGRAVAESGIDFLVTVGPEADVIREEAAQRGVSACHFNDPGEAAEFLSSRLDTGDALLVKGARVLRLEDVLMHLKEIRVALREGNTPANAAGGGD